jgi:hypothetical protein
MWIIDYVYIELYTKRLGVKIWGEITPGDTGTKRLNNTGLNLYRTKYLMSIIWKAKNC